MNKDFLLKADSFKPKILTREIKPVEAVDFIKDEASYQNTKKIAAAKPVFYFTGDKICLDFGRHITGGFKFKLKEYDTYIDAPVKLKIKFGETPYEMRYDFSSYNGGLCSSWLQEEIITVDIKGEVKLPRRYAFRYAEIAVLATRQKVIIDDFTAIAGTSADYNAIDNTAVSDEFKKIDTVSVDTLAECMQDFFEDGPKRDRRLWSGDLRLEALTNYYTFGNIDIVKRCLYLFAATEEENRLLTSCLYTKPEVEASEAHLVSYALLYVVSLCDYFEYTNDKKTVEDLFDVARRQIEITKKMLDKNGILTMPENYGWWSFIDWTDVEPVTSTMGIYIYAVNSFADLCEKLGKKDFAKDYKDFSDKLKEASLSFLYDGNAFKNEYDKNQYSVHSQIWMILAEVISGDKAEQLLAECIENDKYLQPVTPYMHHYVTEAFFKLGMTEKAREYIHNYWGKMIELGADTFGEVFSINDPYLSPYDDAVMNSACHAWSCTPAYFIRKYKL